GFNARKSLYSCHHDPRSITPRKFSLCIGKSGGSDAYNSDFSGCCESVIKMMSNFARSKNLSCSENCRCMPPTMKSVSPYTTRIFFMSFFELTEVLQRCRMGGAHARGNEPISE